MFRRHGKPRIVSPKTIIGSRELRAIAPDQWTRYTLNFRKRNATAKGENSVKREISHDHFVQFVSNMERGSHSKESALHSPDDKHYPLAQVRRAPQPRQRGVRKKDFSLPKPYRRQLFYEQPDRLTRLQVSLLGFAGLMVATLVGVLALLAHESEHSPDGKLIVTAPEARRTAYSAPPARAESELPPALRHGPRTPPPLKAKPAPRLAAIPVKPKPPAPAPDRAALPVAAPDPDVVLITAILLLTPAPSPAPLPAVSMELAGCTRVATPSCSK
jgi:hypothetical protein